MSGRGRSGTARATVVNVVVVIATAMVGVRRALNRPPRVPRISICPIWTIIWMKSRSRRSMRPPTTWTLLAEMRSAARRMPMLMAARVVAAGGDAAEAEAGIATRLPPVKVETFTKRRTVSILAALPPRERRDLARTHDPRRVQSARAAVVTNRGQLGRIARFASSARFEVNVRRAMNAPLGMIDRRAKNDQRAKIVRPAPHAPIAARDPRKTNRSTWTSTMTCWMMNWTRPPVAIVPRARGWKNRCMTPIWKTIWKMI